MFVAVGCSTPSPEPDLKEKKNSASVASPMPPEASATVAPTSSPQIAETPAKLPRPKEESALSIPPEPLPTDTDPLPDSEPVAEAASTQLPSEAIRANATVMEPVTTPNSASESVPTTAPQQVQHAAMLGPIEPNSMKRAWLWLPVIVVLGAIFTKWRYRRSAVSAMRQRLHALVRDFEHIADAERSFRSARSTDMKNAAAAYIADFRRQQFRTVTLDDIKALAPGARMQPMRDQGLTTLLDLQGWTVERLRQLRGIGPDSAIRIAAACETARKAVFHRPVPHPSISEPNSTVKPLYRGVYLVGQTHAVLAGASQDLAKALAAFKPKVDRLMRQTRFTRWLWGSEKSGPLKSALDEGTKLCRSVNEEVAGASVFEQVKERLSNLERLVSAPVESETIREDMKTRPEHYRTAFTELLGPAAVVPVTLVPPIPPKPFVPASEPVQVRPRDSVDVGFTIEITSKPNPPQRDLKSSAAAGSDCWVPQHHERKVAGFKLPDGMLYVGRHLPSVDGMWKEPALVSPALSVDASNADCRLRMLDYWPSYWNASPRARASYLQWLSTGRSDPQADLGYVFLYFYGLERRALFEALHDVAAKQDLPRIIAEVERLRRIYANNGSFDRYTAEFLDFLDCQNGSLASGVVQPELRPNYLSFAMRRHLGCLARDGTPLSAEWAYVWFHNDPRSRQPTVARRCPEQVAALFRLEYVREHGPGLILPANRTRLRSTYRPASASFQGAMGHELDLPDVTVTSSSYGKLEAIAENCFKQLDGYSRYLGRNENSENAFEAQILLPPDLWSADRRERLEELRAKAQIGEAVLSLKQLLRLLGAPATLSRNTYLAVCRALGQAGIGVDPDPRFGGRMPDANAATACFIGTVADAASETFPLAALVVQLAAVIAGADGTFAQEEAAVLRKWIEANDRLDSGEQARLSARLALYRLQPPPLTGIKSVVDRLDASERTEIADFLLTIVYADRTVSPAEVKAMERIYRLFGLEVADLYTRLHELAAGTATTDSPGPTSSAIGLDMQKVAQLRAASEIVGRRLAEIFNADIANEVPPVEPDTEEMAVERRLGLDAAHDELLSILLSRVAWTRAEFEEVCADKDLMPDGALERINEAAFDQFDEPLIEGDDPLEVAVHLLEETQYAVENKTP